MTPIRWVEETDQVRLGLPTDLDLPMAQPLVDSLRLAFSQPRAVRVDASEVERVSSASVQVLLAASIQASEHGTAFVIARPSESFTEMCATLGLADWLKQWSAS